MALQPSTLTSHVGIQGSRIKQAALIMFQIVNLPGLEGMVTRISGKLPSRPLSRASSPPDARAREARHRSKPGASQKHTKSAPEGHARSKPRACQKHAKRMLGARQEHGRSMPGASKKHDRSMQQEQARSTPGACQEHATSMPEGRLPEACQKVGCRVTGANIALFAFAVGYVA